MNDRNRDPKYDDLPDEGDEYPDATFLYIRTHPADDGTEPLAPGLSWWQSPDIVVITPTGARGAEAVPDKQNSIEVTVTNAGGMPATDAFVDVFNWTPGTVLTPANAKLIGDGYLSVPPISTASISFPWTPTSSDAGHRCLLARVSLIIPPDTYTNVAAFEVRDDRHVAQRNIHVVAIDSAQESVSFAFMVANPDLETEREFEIRVVENTRHLGGQKLIQAISCGVAPRLADGELAGINVRVERRDKRRPTLAEQAPLTTGVLRERTEPGENRRTSVALPPNSSKRAIVTLARNPDARPNEVSAVNVEQYDPESEQLVGGLTILLVYR